MVLPRPGSSARYSDPGSGPPTHLLLSTDTNQWHHHTLGKQISPTGHLRMKPTPSSVSLWCRCWGCSECSVWSSVRWWCVSPSVIHPRCCLMTGPGPPLRGAQVLLLYKPAPAGPHQPQDHRSQAQPWLSSPWSQYIFAGVSV